MSMSVTTFETVELAGEGARLAVVKDDTLFIYPDGLGRGPMIVMSTKDWARITREVRFAFMRAEGLTP